MNKRQRKKKQKKIDERLSYIWNKKYVVLFGRKSGKTSAIKFMMKACLSKKYKNFKIVKRQIDKLVK